MNPENDISQERFEAAEAFLSGKMQGARRAEFAERVSADPDTKADVEFVRDAILAAEEHGLREDMDSAHRLLDSGRRHNFSWLPIAAVFLVLIGAAAWWFFPAEGEYGTEEALFARFAAPDPGLPVPMSASAADTYSFYDAMVDYKTEDYVLAARKWRELSDSSPDNDTLTYYIGAAEFNTGNYPAAARQFEAVLTSGPSVFADKARLYLALSLLKTGDSKKIRSLEVPESASYADTLKQIKQKIGG